MMGAAGLRKRTQVLGSIFIVLFLAVQVAVIVQSTKLTEAREAYQSATYPVTDLANTQRQAERLRSSIIAGDAGLIATDLGLYRRQVAVTLSPSHAVELQPATEESLRTQSMLLDELIADRGPREILDDPQLRSELLRRADEVSRVAKEGYDREEQLFFSLMLSGVDESSQLATILVALGAMTLLVGVAFALALLRRTRETLAEANGRLRTEVAERIEGEQRLAIAYEEARGSEARARAAATEIETLHRVVVAGVGGGADEVAGRVASELVARHDFPAIAVALWDKEGQAPRVAAIAGGELANLENRTGELLEQHGPAARVMAGGRAEQLPAGDYATILTDAGIVQVAPIKAGPRVLGALVVEGQGAEPDISLTSVQRLADQLGLLLEAARAFDDQRELAERFRELDELKTEFVATVSHELRTPLTAIVGMALTLDQYWERVGEPERRDMVSRMRRQARRQQRLVDDLLTVSRVQQAGITLRPEAVPLRLCTEAVARDLEVEIQIEVPASLRAWADRDHFERMLTNYLTNAAKYAGGDEVVVRAHETEDGTIEVAVVDTGPGVPEEFQQVLFDSFTQASTGATRTAQGVGLGLSIVRTLADANEGVAWFRPGKPTGSVFGVTLPSMSHAPSAAAAIGAVAARPTELSASDA